MDKSTIFIATQLRQRTQINYFDSVPFILLSLWKILREGKIIQFTEADRHFQLGEFMFGRKVTASVELVYYKFICEMNTFPITKGCTEIERRSFEIHVLLAFFDLLTFFYFLTKWSKVFFKSLEPCRRTSVISTWSELCQNGHSPFGQKSHSV